MRLHLKSSAISPEEQRANDGRRPQVVLAVLGVLFLYVYAFTDVAEDFHLPSPQVLVESTGLKIPLLWDSDHNVNSHLWVVKTHNFNSDDERLIVFVTVLGAFLCAYFFPLGYKKPAIVVWFLAGFSLLYGYPAGILFTAMHLLIYLLFHPQGKYSLAVSAECGALLGYYFMASSGYSAVTKFLAAGVGACLFYLVYFFIIIRLLRFRHPAGILRMLAIQSPLIISCSGAFFEKIHGEEWKIPIGLLLFFWQWMRLMVYHQDFKEGEVPADLSLFGYLHVFLTPGILPNWTYSAYVGQGYSYLTSRFLCEDKNLIVLAGVRLLLLAFVYLVFADLMVTFIISVFYWSFGVVVFPYTTQLVRAYHNGQPITSMTVLMSTLMDQVRVFLIFGGITHFRVAVWRILGYQVDPQYDRFWLATNLVSLWRRYAFHFREFLVRTFYYPTFFRFFKKKLILRVFVATMAATAIGNHLWGHIPDRLLDKGMTYYYLMTILKRWPYFLLLGLGISLTQVYLMRKGRTRKPWTSGWHIITDVLCTYLTFQYFSLIHIYARPHPNGSLWESTKLFLKGLGIDIG